jgi:hypothetical protein
VPYVLFCFCSSFTVVHDNKQCHVFFVLLLLSVVHDNKQWHVFFCFCSLAKRHMSLFVIMNECNQRATTESTWHCLYRNRYIMCHGRAMCLLIDSHPLASTSKPCSQYMAHIISGQTEMIEHVDVFGLFLHVRTNIVQSNMCWPPLFVRKHNKSQGLNRVAKII